MSDKDVPDVEEPNQTTPQEDCQADSQVNQLLVPKLHLKLPKVNIVLTRCDIEKSSEKGSTKPM